MKKWLDEGYEFEVTGYLRGGYLRGNKAEGLCRNEEEIGDRYLCTYGCPVNQEGYGICPKVMLMLYPLMEAVRSGGDLRNVRGYDKNIVCHDGCAMLRLTA